MVHFQALMMKKLLHYGFVELVVLLFTFNTRFDYAIPSLHLQFLVLGSVRPTDMHIFLKGAIMLIERALINDRLGILIKIMYNENLLKSIITILQFI